MFKVKNNFIGILRHSASLFNDHKLLTMKAAPPFLPFYHLASDKNPAYLRHLYPVKPLLQFEKELDYILANFHPITANDLIQKNKEGSWGTAEKNYVHFTFDDGLSEMNETVIPLLKRKGVPATFFINTAFLDDKDLFYRYRVSLLIDEIEENRVNDAQLRTLKDMLIRKGYYKGDMSNSLLNLDYSHKDLIKNICRTMLYEREIEKIYFSAEEVKSLLSDGFTIGAHSVDHPLYSSLDLASQKTQTLDSIEQLTSQFNLDYRLFAFPFTDNGVSLEFFEWLHDAKKPLVDLSFGTAGLKGSTVTGHLQRLAMEIYNGNPANRIKSEYLYYKILKISGNQNVKYS